MPHKEKVLLSRAGSTFYGTFSDAAIVQTRFPQPLAHAPIVVRGGILNEKTTLNPSSGEAEREKFEAIFQTFKPLIYGDIREIAHSFCKNFAKNSDIVVYVGNSVTCKLFLLL